MDMDLQHKYVIRHNLYAVNKPSNTDMTVANAFIGISLGTLTIAIAWLFTVFMIILKKGETYLEKRRSQAIQELVGKSSFAKSKHVPASGLKIEIKRFRSKIPKDPSYHTCSGTSQQSETASLDTPSSCIAANDETTTSMTMTTREGKMEDATPPSVSATRKELSALCPAPEEMEETTPTKCKPLSKINTNDSTESAQLHQTVKPVAELATRTADEPKTEATAAKTNEISSVQNVYSKSEMRPKRVISLDEFREQKLKSFEGYEAAKKRLRNNFSENDEQAKRPKKKRKKGKKKRKKGKKKRRKGEKDRRIKETVSKQEITAMQVSPKEILLEPSDVPAS